MPTRELSAKEWVAMYLGWGLKRPAGRVVWIIRGITHHKVIVERASMDDYDEIDRFGGLPIREVIATFKEETDMYVLMSPEAVESVRTPVRTQLSEKVQGYIEAHRRSRSC